MDEASNPAHRDRLLDDFRKSLDKPLSERFFDEDDLIEIFDYAGDLGDDYLRMESLMCAARFYPDSEEMKQRRAIFYSQYGDDVCRKFLSDNRAERGMLWDILRVRRNSPSGDEARKALDFLINNYDDFSDEEIIQLVDLASVLGQYEWLKENMDTLRRKAAYQTMLLYEVCVAADNNRDVQYSISLLEELTEIDPFNPNYWQMLAKEYYAGNDNAKAVTAIDYALAIDADDLQSQLVKANLLYAQDKPLDQVIVYTEAIVAKDPDNLDAVKFLAQVYGDADNSEMSLRILEEYLSRNPSDAPYVVPDIVTMRPANIDRLLDLFYEYNEDNSQVIWASWAQNLSVNGFHDVARKVADCYQRNSGIKLVMLFTIEDSFASFDNQATVKAIEQFVEEMHNNEANLPSLVVMHTVSLARMGEFDRALAMIDMIRTRTSMAMYRSVSSRLEYLGLLQVLDRIYNRIQQTRDPDDWSNYSPWQSPPSS